MGEYGVCLYPECKAELTKRNVRGLCTKDYYGAARLVRQKRTTWEELEKNGRVGPKKAMGKKGDCARTVWFLSKDEKTEVK